MAISYYEGTNEGSNSGWQRRFHAELKSSTGKVYRVEIIDSRGDATRAAAGFGGTGSQPFLCGSDGFTISWDGKSDDLHAPFIESTCTLDFLIEGTYHRQLWSQLQLMEDDRFGVAIWEHEPSASSSTSTTTADPSPDGTWAPVWFGILQAEGVEFVDHETNEFLRLTFTDGLPRLNEILFQDDSGDNITAVKTLAELIEICLAKIPTATLYGYGFGTGAGTISTSSTVPMWTEDVYYMTDQHATPTPLGAYSVFQSLRVPASAFYDIKREQDALGGDFVRRDASSCAEVLRHILSVMRMRLSMVNGTWRIQNTATQLEDVYRQTFVHDSHVATLSPSTQGTQVTAAAQRIALTDSNDSDVYVPTRGLASGLMFPIKAAISTHQKGGAVRLVSGVPFDLSSVGVYNSGQSVYIVRHNTSATTTTVSNSEAIISGDTPFFLKADCVHTDVGAVFGIDTSVPNDFRGAQILLSFRIKVGNYYLKRTLVNESDDINIDVFGGADIGFTGFKQSGSVEWTTNSANRYQLIVPMVGSEPEPPVVLTGSDNDVQRVGGLHLALGDDGDEFRFRNNFTGQGTLQSDLNFALEWVPPPLPGGTHTGIEFSATAQYYTAGNSEITGSSLTNNVDIDAVMLWNSFGIYSSTDTAEEDINFSSTYGANTAVTQVAESILGDKYTNANLATWKDRNPDGGTNWEFTGASWRTLTNDSSFYVHKLNTVEAISERAVPVRTFSGTIAYNYQEHALPAYNNLTYSERLSIDRPIRYKVTEGGSTVEFDAVPLSLTWTARSNTFDGLFAVMDVDRTLSVTSDDDTDKLISGSGVTGTDTPSDVGATMDLLALKSTGLTNTANITSNSTTLTNITNVLKTTLTGDGAGVYADSGKATTASHMSLTTTTAKIQAGGGNTVIDLSESSPGSIEFAVQVGPSGSEVSRTALLIEGTSGSQTPNLTISANVSGVSLGDLDDVTTSGVSNDQVLAWNGTNFVPVDQTGGSGAADTDAVELKMFFLEQ